MLNVNNLTKTFAKGTADEKKALNNISLTLTDGEFVSIIGGNGAGKSTLLNCISGVYEADNGAIFIDNKNVTHMPEYKRSAIIGRVFQDPLKGTAFDMTIEENLAIACAKNTFHGLGHGLQKKDITMFREKLSLLGLGLENRMKHKAGLLSGGQRQALSLLMATVTKPKLLLLDEHTAALDPATARKVLELTAELVSEEGICTLMVTHNMKAALELGTRTIMMNEGKIVLDLSGSERENATVERLIDLFEIKTGQQMDNDRMML